MHGCLASVSPTWQLSSRSLSPLPSLLCVEKKVLISDNHVDVKLRDGLVVGGGGGGGAGSAAAAEAVGKAGVGGVSSYRARLLPFVDGGDLVDLLAKQDTVRGREEGKEGALGRVGRGGIEG